MTKSNLQMLLIQFNASLIFFAKLETNLKIDMEVQRPQVDKTILRKNIHSQRHHDTKFQIIP